MVSCRALLHRYIYKDRATVYRAVENRSGWKNEREFETVYRDIPCHLAQYGKELAAHRDDRAQIITEDLRLNCDPEYEILENDVIEVQHRGQIFKLIAGTAFNYGTHKEISVRRRKEARQA